MTNQKSRLLVIKYPFILALKKKGLNKYSLIGGNIEKNESPEKALIREVREEVKIKLLKTDFSFFEKITYQKGDIIYQRNYFVLNHTEWKFKVNEPEKFDSVEWIDFFESRDRLKKSDYKIINKLFKSQ